MINIVNMSDAKNTLIDNNDTVTYSSLIKYRNNALINSKAYKYSETYFRDMFRHLRIALVVLSATISVCTSVDVNTDIARYSIMVLSYFTLLVSGVMGIYDPADRYSKANQFATEFGEIASNIDQFLTEKHNKKQIEEFTHIQHELMNVWGGQAPPVSDRFISKATKQVISRPLRGSRVVV